jgi:hypothetical protein
VTFDSIEFVVVSSFSMGMIVEMRGGDDVQSSKGDGIDLTTCRGLSSLIVLIMTVTNRMTQKKERY